jgi:hypothetical protein
MRTRPLMVILLLAALGSLSLAAVLKGPMLPGCPCGLLPAALALSQVGLLAVWLGLGNEGAAGRAAALIATAGAWAGATWTSGLADQRGVGTLLALLTTEAISVAGALVALRSAGMRIVDVTQPGWPRSETADHARFHFGLGDLLSWTVALAMLLSLAQLARRIGVVWPGSQGLAVLVPFAVGLTMTTLAATWTALGSRGAALGWLSIIAGVAVAARAFPGVGGGFLLAALFAALTLGPLAAFRVCGYRLVPSAPGRRGQTARRTA